MKTIVILGATGGIGSDISETLSLQPHNLILVGKDEKKLNLLQDKLSQNKAKISILVADFLIVESINNLRENILSNFNDIDWVINSIGYIDEKEPCDDFNMNTLSTTFQINTLSIIQFSETIKPHIKKNGGIINISSTASLWGNDQYRLYSSSKSALNTYSQSLARYFSKNNRNLSSMVISPGATNTTMRERVAHDSITQQDPSYISNAIDDIVLGKSKFKNGDNLIIKDGESTLHSEL